MNNRCITVQYPPLAGGKFVAHCLSMSSHVIPLGKYELIERFVHDDCVRSRLEYVLSTFPPDTSQLQDWRQFEARRYAKDWNMPAAIINSNKFYFFITHVNLDSSKIDDHVISLTNSRKFRAQNTLVGKHTGFHDNYNQIREEGWPDYPLLLEDISDYILNRIVETMEYQESCQGNMLLDVDSTIFNKKDFLYNIETFANTIGIEDLDMAAVNTIYDIYISLHQ
jgi:hypothetical protein